MVREIENANIKSTRFGTEDHGILTFFIHVEGDGWGQGFGGWALDGWVKSLERRVGHPKSTDLLLAIMVAVGVEAWEDLPGKPVRICREGGKIVGIGHFVKNKWIYPEEFFALADATP